MLLALHILLFFANELHEGSNHFLRNWRAVYVRWGVQGMESARRTAPLATSFMNTTVGSHSRCILQYVAKEQVRLTAKSVNRAEF